MSAAAPERPIDGFYVAWMSLPPPEGADVAAHGLGGEHDLHTGQGHEHGHDEDQGGQGFVLAVFREGTIVGVDPGGCRYDGRYETGADGRLVAAVHFAAAPDITLFGDVPTGPEGLAFDMLVPLDDAALSGTPFSVETPLGSLTLRLERLRDL
jgi:hypothetical protein